MSQARDISQQYPAQSVLTSSSQCTVYRSEDQATRRQVAVKLLTPLAPDKDEVVQQKYLKAVGAVQFLKLAAFPELIDFGITKDNSAFAVMESIKDCAESEIV